MSRRCVSMSSSRKLSGKLPAEDVPPETSEHDDEPGDDDGGEIVHVSHPEHRLARFDFPYLFMCMGCREYGAGRRFMCQTCGFQVHKFCALAPPSLHDHSFHPKHQHLLFFVKPGGFLRCKCDICGKAVRGFSFRCASCSFDMLSCCAAMGRRMDRWSSRPRTSTRCSWRRRGDDELRVPGLQAEGAAGAARVPVPALRVLPPRQVRQGHGERAVRARLVPPEKQNALATAAKVTVNALFGVIGGLIEGIGEGIDEAFVENLGRSRRSFR